jgi:nucleoside-diphosphate-sugar epimerase
MTDHPFKRAIDRRPESAEGEWTLVTGGAGYVGSVVVEELISRGRHVRVLDSLEHGVSSLVHVWGHERFGFVRGDVRDRETRRAALDHVRDVVHLAAIVGDPACARDPDLARDVNLDATRELLADAEAVGAERFVFASTCSNYGRMADSSVYASEDCELRPVSLYAETKVSAELEVLKRSGNGFAGCCLRFATVYGTSPRMRFDLTVNEFARDMLLGGSLVVYGEQFWRPYIHVRDAARAVALSLEAPVQSIAGDVFNVGDTRENYRKLDLVELLRERLPHAEVEFVHRDEDPRDYRVGFDKVGATLGFAVTRTVPDGIGEVLELLQSGLISDPYAPLYRN